MNLNIQHGNVKRVCWGLPTRGTEAAAASRGMSFYLLGNPFWVILYEGEPPVIYKVVREQCVSQSTGERHLPNRRSRASTETRNHTTVHQPSSPVGGENPLPSTVGRDWTPQIALWVLTQGSDIRYRCAGGRNKEGSESFWRTRNGWTQASPKQRPFFQLVPFVRLLEPRFLVDYQCDSSALQSSHLLRAKHRFSCSGYNHGENGREMFPPCDVLCGLWLLYIQITKSTL